MVLIVHLTVVTVKIMLLVTLLMDLVLMVVS